jgi:hypothetical protein
MPLFRKLSKPAPAAAAAEIPDLPVDELMGDAAAHHFKAQLAEGRWQEFHDFLDGITDWDDRHFYLDRLASIEDRPEWIDEWIAARPASAIPVVFSGIHRVDWAWQARGGGRARTVERDAWPVFHGRLVEAERELARAAALDPADPTPYVRGMHVAMGLSLGQAEIRRRFGEVMRRHRWHQAAHAVMVQAIARKWAGSSEAMFEFARSVAAEAPEGSPVHKVIAIAHVEQWLDLPETSADGTELMKVYFRREEVKAEVRAAAEHSIRSPRYQPGRLTPVDRNIFAMCFWLMHDYPAQLEQMRLIGRFNQSYPWAYQGKPGWAYERARVRALERA